MASTEGDAEIATDKEPSNDLGRFYDTKFSNFRDVGKEQGLAEAKRLEDIYITFRKYSQVAILLDYFPMLTLLVQDPVFQQMSILPEEIWQERL